MLPLFESGIPLLRERLRQLPDSNNITIAYPDEGAWKRFHYQFGDYPEVRCSAGCIDVRSKFLVCGPTDCGRLYRMGTGLQVAAAVLPRARFLEAIQAPA